MKSNDLFNDVDTKINEWRQGDCVLQEQEFIYRYNAKFPLTINKSKKNENGIKNASVKIIGFTVITQTCDLIRGCKDRPFVETAILEKVDDQDYRLIKSGKMPRYVAIPLLENKKIVCDLDKIMTIEKPMLTDFQRVDGCGNDVERKNFAIALSRKRMRPAFPNSFVEYLKPLRERWIDKHSKSSEEGEILRGLAEIRVYPETSWDADEVLVHFWFITRDDMKISESSITSQIVEWFKKLDGSSKYRSEFALVSYAEITAKEYITSFALDYDHLSTSR